VVVDDPYPSIIFPKIQSIAGIDAAKATDQKMPQNRRHLSAKFALFSARYQKLIFSVDAN
jgi:hypothetical protein